MFSHQRSIAILGSGRFFLIFLLLFIIGADSSILALPRLNAVEYREDYNNDGKLNISDVIALLLLARENPSDPRVDYNGDGAWSITDAIALLINILSQIQIQGQALDIKGNPIPNLDVFVINESRKERGQTDENGNFSILYEKTDSAMVVLSDSLRNWYNFTRAIKVENSLNLDLPAMMQKRTYVALELIIRNGVGVGIDTVNIDFLNYFKYIKDVGVNSSRDFTKKERT